MSRPATLEILTAARLDMCKAGVLFALDNPDPQAAITSLLSDRSPPRDRPEMVGLDCRGWEFLRYVCNNLPGCERCCTSPSGCPVTWPDGAQTIRSATVRAAVNLRRWLDHLPSEIKQNLIVLDRVGPELFLSLGDSLTGTADTTARAGTM